MIELKSYSLETNQGPHLNLNEDNIDVDLGLQLFMIIDGFGGSNVGDHAAMACRDYIKRFFGKVSRDPDSTLPFYYSQKYIIETNALINSFRGAHEQVFKENQTRSISNRGGASVIALSLSENLASIVTTGNCQALCYRKGNIFPLTIPDSFAGAPMSGIGLFEDLQFQVHEFKVLPNDTLLLLTDGAYFLCYQDEIQELIAKNLENDKTIITEIFKHANDRGNLDNQSAMILRF
jgi:serine/threonine protein phosphatase PrpC